MKKEFKNIEIGDTFVYNDKLLEALEKPKLAICEDRPRGYTLLCKRLDNNPPITRTMVKIASSLFQEISVMNRIVEFKND